MTKVLRILGIAVPLGLTGCVIQPIRYTVPTPTYAEAISFLGDTLWSLPLDVPGGPARVARLNTARALHAGNPGGAGSQLALARANAAMGRFREAVSVMDTALQANPLDVRLYRLRAEFLLWLREPKLAIKDFRRATRIGPGSTVVSEVFELPGEGVRVGSLRYETALLLGFALYSTGDYRGARKSLFEAVEYSATPDEVSRALLWLFFTTRRLRDSREAREVLAMVDPAWAAGSERPEIQLLLAYRGLLPSDSIQVRATGPDRGDRAMYSYAVGYFLALNPERVEEAERWFEHARTGRNWASLPFLAAEADLARIRKVPPR